MRRLAQRCDLLDVLNAVEQGPVPWHTHNRAALTGRIYEFFDRHTVDDNLRLSMLRQVTARVEEAERHGYIEVSLCQVRLSVKGREYLNALD